MADLKLYQIPRSVLAKEPKPILEIDFIEEMQEKGFDKALLEAPDTLSLIGSIADTLAGRLGHVAKINYGVISLFDPEQMAEYQKLLENYRMNPPAAEGTAPEAGTESSGKKKKKKKKKKK